jgi:hypothetical protein
MSPEIFALPVTAPVLRRATKQKSAFPASWQEGSARQIIGTCAQPEVVLSAAKQSDLKQDEVAAETT